MTEHRTAARIRHHYEVERALARRLRASTADERVTLYRDVYDQLFREVPDHPQLHRTIDPAAIARRVRYGLAMLAPFAGPEVQFLEIGAGDCALAFAVAPQVARVIAVDVAELATGARPPANFELRLTTGPALPLGSSTIDVAYSYQLVEHLHPDDVAEHLREVARVLRPGGRYLCVTPHRYTGPHDVSRHFDEVAVGLHLKEYTYVELAELLRVAGFTDVRPGARRRLSRGPARRPRPGRAFALRDVASAPSPLVSAPPAQRAVRVSPRGPPGTLTGDRGARLPRS